MTFDTSSMAGTDFLTPGGLNAFTVALPAKTEKLLLKDLPKIIKASGISKKNYRPTIDALNVGIGQLWKTAIAENSTTRSIHDVAKEALKRGSKSLDDALKKVVNSKKICPRQSPSSEMCPRSCAKPCLVKMPLLPRRRQHRRP